MPQITQIRGGTHRSFTRGRSTDHAQNAFGFVGTKSHGILDQFQRNFRGRSCEQFCFSEYYFALRLLVNFGEYKPLLPILLWLFLRPFFEAFRSPDTYDLRVSVNKWDRFLVLINGLSWGSLNYGCKFGIWYGWTHLIRCG